eukprot:Gregarina_sp_Pseudo_9__5352@NODE_63_length_4661_cov_162_085894_g58_i0_p1_GENE_NODE_63_length_4661_cov_162_085894_g58_i0NODE_63_length_4661_cov_162_085894_g58_i0_p1_ORF_typecomplete_len696_score215_04Arm/PF00514_23/0_0028Arm/PF00514_23/5_3e10Arm/PF00514_23/4_1Arm/PF00514_23/2_5e03KAP/PF05804_12/0_0058KAP/PF05804_12/0_026HEAT_2/PF13646_6/0_025HEAT_2/PF13646_6/0_23Proteasom_PSMB/PF10508_9/0_021Proteasom_PSMB/PF10508_9/1Arm_2/PF04826_13/0_0011Arm_2/PF04826_13/75CLASP_N/PF12348_8/64CLASP_N/PF12348_8/
MQMAAHAANPLDGCANEKSESSGGMKPEGSNEQLPRHPPPAPPPPRKLHADQSSAPAETDAELEALSSMMTSFNWSGDAVESCAKVILDPESPSSAKLKGVLQLKQLLCTSREHVFCIAQDVIDSGVLKALVSFISSDTPYAALKLPSAFCLTNIAAGQDDQTAAVVEAGAIPPCLELLRSREESLRRQAIFCLANIAGSTPEFRRTLASHSQYFESIIYAVIHANDPKVEELAGWNIRNMCVLGGPDFEQVRTGLDFFAGQLVRSTPPLSETRSMLINGTATFISVAHGSNANWTRAVSYNPFTAGGFRTSGHVCMNAAVLRFACETFSWISRSPEGRADIVQQELVLPLLYHAKFSSNYSVRSHSAECLANLAQYGPVDARHQLEKSGALIALSELLADHITYPPHQRVLAARCLYWLAMEGYVGGANAMVEHNVVTREVARRVIAARNEQRAREAAAAVEAQDENDDDQHVGADMGFDQLAGEDDPRYSLGLDLAYEGSLAAKGRYGDSPWDTLDVHVRGASTLEVAYLIFNQVDRPEEFSLREKCGRMLVAILSKVTETVLYEAMSPDTFKLLLDILDVAADVDVQTCLAGEISQVTPSGPLGASSMDALKVGEPELPAASFVNSVLNLMQRLFDIGEDLKRREQILENPVSVMLRQCDGLQRIENAIGQSALPFEVIQRAIVMIQTYCHP